jgi:hypothetical protein
LAARQTVWMCLARALGQYVLQYWQTSELSGNSGREGGCVGARGAAAGGGEVAEVSGCAGVGDREVAFPAAGSTPPRGSDGAPDGALALCPTEDAGMAGSEGAC